MQDRDAVCGEVVKRRLRGLGIRDRPIAPKSPWQNLYVERLIGSARRECIDLIMLGESHLRRIMSRYAEYYNENLDAPAAPCGLAAGHLAGRQLASVLILRTTMILLWRVDGSLVRLIAFYDQ